MCKGGSFIERSIHTGFIRSGASCPSTIDAQIIENAVPEMIYVNTQMILRDQRLIYVAGRAFSFSLYPRLIAKLGPRRVADWL